MAAQGSAVSAYAQEVVNHKGGSATAAFTQEVVNHLSGSMIQAFVQSGSGARRRSIVTFIG